MQQGFTRIVSNAVATWIRHLKNLHRCRTDLGFGFCINVTFVVKNWKLFNVALKK